MSRPRLLIVIALLYAAAATALGHVDYHIRSSRDHGFSVYTPAVLEGRESPPARYRVLAPYAYEGVRTLTGLEPRGAWILFRWLSIVAALVATHMYLRTWWEHGPAVAGTLLVAALTPLTFTNGWAHPDHLMELWLFTLGCACIARGRVWALAIVLAANALNRETSVFLLPLFLLAGRPGAKRVRQAAALAGVWAAIYLGLRWRLGFQSYDPWQFWSNIEFLRLLPESYDPYYRAYAWFFVGLVAPVIAAAAAAWPLLPRMIKVAVGLVAPAFVTVCFLFSSVIETRIFTPLLPLTVPVMVFALFGGTGRREDSAGRVPAIT